MTGRGAEGEESTAGEEHYTWAGEEKSRTHKHLNLTHQSIDGTFSELI